MRIMSKNLIKQQKFRCRDGKFRTQHELDECTSELVQLRDYYLELQERYNSIK